MRLTYFDLEIIQLVHKAMLNKKGRGLIDQTTKNLNIGIKKFINILKFLNDIGVITDLKIRSQLFTCKLIEKDNINSELLMKKYDMFLAREDLEKKARIEVTRMKRLQEENRFLKEEISKLNREITRLRLKNTEVISGD